MTDGISMLGIIQASGSSLALSARGIGPFALYLGLMVAFVSVHLSIYMKVTSHDELRLIREGNLSAALSTVGAMLGLAIPLTSVVSMTGFLLETVLWAVVALLVQLGAYFAARLVVKDLSARIDRGEIAAGLWVAGVSLTAGLLQAVCMKP